MTQALPPPPVVLLVEDDTLVRTVVATFMEDEGMEVVEASDADKALEVLEHRSDIRLLFTDINMPGSMDGLDLAREVRKRWPQVLLMLTSGRRPPLTHIPKTSEFVPKPYDFDQLTDRIQRMLKR